MYFLTTLLEKGVTPHSEIIVRDEPPCSFCNALPQVIEQSLFLFFVFQTNLDCFALTIPSFLAAFAVESSLLLKCMCTLNGGVQSEMGEKERNVKMNSHPKACCKMALCLLNFAIVGEETRFPFNDIIGALCTAYHQP